MLVGARKRKTVGDTIAPHKRAVTAVVQVPSVWKFAGGANVSPKEASALETKSPVKSQ